MFWLILYILLLIIMWRIQKKTSLFSRILYLVYLASAVCGLLLCFDDGEAGYAGNTKTYTPLLFLFVIVTLWIEPYKNLKAVAMNENYKGSNRHFEFVSNMACIYWLPLTALLFYNAYHIMTTVDVSVFRLEKDYYSYFTGGPFFALSVYSSMLSFVPQFLFFLSYRYNCSFIKRAMLLFCSFSFTFMTLCFAGRDGIVYWLMNSLVFFFYFKDSYDAKQKKRVRNIFLIAGSVIVAIFLAITFFRFIIGGGGDSGFLKPILSYAGQQVHIFCQTTELSPEKLAQLESFDYLTMTFGTFVKGFYTMYGYVGTAILSLILFFVVRYAVQCFNRSRVIWDFFIVYLFFQIPLYGVFYYRQGEQSMELVYVIAIVLFILFKKLKIKTIRI